MPTIRITEKTWKKLNEVTIDMFKEKEEGFNDILKVTPDTVINSLIISWNLNVKYKEGVDYETTKDKKEPKKD